LEDAMLMGREEHNATANGEPMEDEVPGQWSH
jgi:hypothetical protein